MIGYLNSVRSEWLKRRNSAASWLTLAGGLIIPVIMLAARLFNKTKTLQINASQDAWDTLFNQCWQFMSILLLPMGIVLTASLICQIEYRNQGWKQLFTTPQDLTTIFLAKGTVVLVMLFQFFLVLTLGIWICGVVPAVILPEVPFPAQPFPFQSYALRSGIFLLDCLPIVAIQYLLSFHIRNFLVPIGIGIGLTTASLIGLSWKYGYLLPYSYGALQYLANDSRQDPTASIHLWASGYFAFALIANYIFFLWRWLPRPIQPSLVVPVVRKGLIVLAISILPLIVAFTMLKDESKPTRAFTSDPWKWAKENTGFVKYKIRGQDAVGIQARMMNHNVPGLSIAIVRNFKVVQFQCFGMADVESHTPVTSDTRFQPGSISKAINALGALRLVAQGKLDLFDNINNHLVSWKFSYDSVSRGKYITTADLLSHTAGLNIHGFGFENYSRSEPLPSAIDILEGKNNSKTPRVQSIFEPGWKFKYSGGGTLISQVIITDIAGIPYDRFMKEEVLDQLGMKKSFFTQPPPAELEASLATGYSMTQHGGPFPGRYPITPQQAAAGLWTTADDLARAIIEIQKALEGESSFLSKTLANLMVTPYHNLNSGLGLFVEIRNGESYFHHGAGNPGFSGWMYGSAEDGNGVAIVANTDTSEEIFHEIIDAVGQAYQWDGFKSPEPVEEIDEIQLNENVLSSYVGYFRLRNRVLTISRKENHLWISDQERTRKMYFDTDTTFVLIEAPEKRKLTASAIEWVEKKQPQRAKRFQEHFPIPAKLATYTGNYIEEGSGDKASLQLHGDRLILYSENAHQPITIHFIAEDEFFLEENGGIFRFRLNAKDNQLQVVNADGTRIILRRKSSW